MVTIRLARKGSKKRPFYHLTVADSRYNKNGRFIERIGYFNPEARGQELPVSLNEQRLDYWVSKGAQLSGRVKNIVKSQKTK